METRCLKCGKAIQEQAATGRPKSYCSIGCRRAAELKIRRLNSRLEKLEEFMSNTRLGCGMETEESIKKIEVEIALQEARLHALLNASAE